MKNLGGGNFEFYEDLFEKYKKLNNISTAKLKVKDSKCKSSKSTSTNLLKLRKESNFSNKSIIQLNKSNNQPKLSETKASDKKMRAISSKKFVELLSKPVSPKKASQKSYDGSRAELKTDELVPMINHAQSAFITDKLLPTSPPISNHIKPNTDITHTVSKKSPKIRSLSRKVNFINNLSGKNIITLRKLVTIRNEMEPNSFNISSKIKESSKILNNAMKAQNPVHNIYKVNLCSSQKLFESENPNINESNLKSTTTASRLPFCCF